MRETGSSQSIALPDAQERQGPPSGFSRDINNYLIKYISQADDKARTVATLDTVALGVVMAWNKTGVVEMPHLLSLAFFVVGAALAALVILPRTPHPGAGMIFWEDIREHGSADKYGEAVLAQNDDDIEKGYAFQNYRVSHVLHSKHQVLQWAMIATALGVISAVIDYWLF